MKLIRFGEVGNEKPGIQLDNGDWIDITAFGQDYDESFFGGNGIEQLKKLPSFIDKRRENAEVFIKLFKND